MNIIYFFLLFFLLINNFIFAKPIIVNSSYNYKLLETSLSFPSGITEKKDNLLISDLSDGNIYSYNKIH